MNNDSNPIRAKHLEALSSAAKRFLLSQVLTVTDAVQSELDDLSGMTLETIQPTVDGALWYQLLDDNIQLCLHHGGHDYSLLNLPHLTVTPSANSISAGGTVTATVSYDGGGALSVESDNASVTPTISGSTITLPFVVFDENTDVTITVSVAQNGNYIPDEKTFTVNYVSPCIVNMPFTTSTTQDLCGNTWTATGSPSVANKYLDLPSGSYLMNNSVTIGGQDFTINGWCYYNSSSGNWCRIFEAAQTDAKDSNCFFLAQFNGTSTKQFTFHTNGNASPFSWTTNQWFHFEIVHQYSSSTSKVYINGSLVATKTGYAIARVARKLRIGKSSWSSDGAFIGYIDDFKIYDGVALHTADFTPPARSA